MKKILFIISLFFVLAGCAAEPTQGEVQIALITDIDHCETRNLVPAEKLHKTVSNIKSTDAKRLISLGDNISHRLGDCSQTAENDLTHVVKALRTFDEGETHFVLGDHDIASATESTTFWETATHRNINAGKNYYSFDEGDIHIIILDTILGGDQLAESCKTDKKCLALKEKDQEKYKAYKKQVSLTRDSQKRDKGRIGNAQLTWLKNDLRKTTKKKILVLSDHPLFALTTERKSYDIIGRVDVKKVLEEASKNAKITAISGEAHVWHHENINEIDYYVLNENKVDNSWALLKWREEPIIIPYINDTPHTPL